MCCDSSFSWLYAEQKRKREGHVSTNKQSECGTHQSVLSFTATDANVVHKKHLDSFIDVDLTYGSVCGAASLLNTTSSHVQLYVRETLRDILDDGWTLHNFLFCGKNFFTVLDQKFEKMKSVEKHNLKRPRSRLAGLDVISLVCSSTRTFKGLIFTGRLFLVLIAREWVIQYRRTRVRAPNTHSCVLWLC